MNKLYFLLNGILFGFDKNYINIFTINNNSIFCEYEFITGINSEYEIKTHPKIPSYGFTLKKRDWDIISKKYISSSKKFIELSLERRKNYIKKLNKIYENKILNKDTTVTICLETMAGKGSELGSNFNELKYIIDNVKYNDKLGVCLDTCHLSDSGYDISNFDNLLDEFDKLIGINKIKCMHINDSKNVIGSKKDRHENIGIGTLGFDNIIKIIYNKRLDNIPKILETPWIKDDNDSYPPYKFEIEMIRNKEFDKEYIDKIKKYYN